MNIVIVGTSGSGKTTLAKQLASLFELKHIELDQLYWKPNWERPNTEEFQHVVSKAISGDSWVLCGNYSLSPETKKKHFN